MLQLKYLFGVKFSDGSEYRQNPEDRSLTEPETRSCFFDVMKRYEEVELFALWGEEHQYLVDLRDGHFEVDEVPFWIGDKPEGKCRLIYHRQHTHQVNMAGEELSHTVTYHMGWQTTGPEGKNHRFVIEVR